MGYAFMLATMDCQVVVLPRCAVCIRSICRAIGLRRGAWGRHLLDRLNCTRRCPLGVRLSLLSNLSICNIVLGGSIFLRAAIRKELLLQFHQATAKLGSPWSKTKVFLAVFFGALDVQLYLLALGLSH